MCRTPPTRWAHLVAIVGLVVAMAAGVAHAQFSEPVNLLFSWDGEADEDRFGFVNRMLGDIDSDGTAEIGIAVPNHDGNGENSGKVYVYSGRTGLLLRTHEGSAANDFLGQEIANVGDVTGDGVPDYLIARPRSTNFSQYFGPGEAILYSGANGDSLRAWNSSQLGLGTGAQVAGAGNFDSGGVGDVNGDGTPDFLITALIANGPGGLVGKVHVISGADWDETLHVLTGEASIDLFGFGMGGLGDLDDDGFDDLVVGAPNAGEGDRGRAYVFSGRTGEQFPFSPFDADTTGAFFGFLFAKGPGDVNADGVPDIAVTDLQDVENGTFAGKVYVYSGADGSVLHRFLGDGPTAGLGVGRGCGDVNHDGYADLIYAAFTDPTIAEFAGTAHIYSGFDGTILRSIRNTLEGDRFGYSTVGAGDVDGDGEPDFLVSANQYDGAGIDRGIVYLISGVSDPADVPPTIGDTGALDSPGIHLRLGPNPARERVGLDFRLATDGPVALEVYDVGGAHVRTLVDEVLTAGQHGVEWDRTTGRGLRVASGVYYVRLRQGADEVHVPLVVR